MNIPVAGGGMERLSMKIIIWGLGNTWKQIKKYTDINEIICFTDNNKNLWGKEIFGKKVIAPKEILNWDFDMVVIASEDFYNEIRLQLEHKLNIPANQVMDYRYYVQMICGRKNGYNQYSFLEMVYCLSAYNGKILDAGNAFVKYGMYSKGIDNVFTLENTEIWGIQDYKIKRPIYRNIYSGFLNSIEDIKGNDFSVLFMSDFEETAHIDVIIDKLKIYFEDVETIIFNTPSYNEKLVSRLSESWNVKFEQFLHSTIYVVERRNTKKDIKIFVVTHKPAHIPADQIYIPIHVGDQEFFLNNMVRDDNGYNIAEYNPFINECTAMYWIWKNVNCDYVGINHYRRYFLKNGYESMTNILNAKMINQIMDNYDVILAPKYYTYFRTVEEHLSCDVCNSEGIEIARQVLKQYQPKYLETFNEVFRNNSIYRCNLFVMSKQNFDKYCEWLFSFILKVSDAIDVTNYDSYSKRMAGFLAERMLTVWLITSNLKIKELPFLVTE